MHRLSSEEIADLADRVNVRLLSTEIDTIREFVNENLSGLEHVDSVPLEHTEYDMGDRRWWVPTEDPHNGIITQCAVPPRDSPQSDLLSNQTIGVKDIIAVAGIPMQCGSESMVGYVPGFDATVIERLRDHGATIIAKTNLDEFAGGARGISHFGQMTNPFDTTRIPGGSSGGSAVAVATGAVDLALGTDTGGSVRMPSSHCGIVGLKPTYGLIPLTGVVENTYTLDHVGPMTRTVEESARMLEAVAGKDPADPASMAAAGTDGYHSTGFVEAVTTPPSPDEVRIGVVAESLGHGVADDTVEPAVVERTERAIDRLDDAGCMVEDVSIELFESSSAIKRAISYVELAAHWRDGAAPIRRGGSLDGGYQTGFAARTRSKSGLVGAYYRARLIAGAYLLEENHGRTYTRAQTARRTLQSAFTEALADVDVLVLPTMAGLPPTVEDADSPGLNYARNTMPANVTGQPAISIPNGLIDDIPTGLQLMSDRFTDAALLGYAALFESIITPE